jgi:hypothetical protein
VHRHIRNIHADNGDFWSFMIGCAPLYFPLFGGESEKIEVYQLPFGWFILPYFTLFLFEKQ